MASTNELREIASGDIKCDPNSYEAGSGGFGDVITGYHKGLKQEVAIKVFAITGGPQEKARLEKIIKEEIQHLLKADHENVVRVLGYVKWPFTMGIVMEYCKGGNLRELLLDASKELGLAVITRFLSQTSSAMASCHNLPDKRLIHEDLKPENIMLTEELQCKVGDFGSAELATYSTSPTMNPLARSKKERPQYTPYYTAPEKLKDPTMKPIKEHDVYGFAMIIHMALSRKNPYPRGDQQRLLDSIMKGKRPDCQEIQDWMQTLVGADRKIAEQLQLLMKRCWDQDPTKRPTMTEISEELNNLLEKQNPDILLSQVASVSSKMSFNQPSTNKSQRVPLHYFSPRTGRFEVSSTISGRTVKQPTEPAGGAQDQGSSEQGEISTSSRSQQPDSRNPTSTGVQRSTETTEESSHSNKSPQQHTREPTGGAQERIQSSNPEQGEILTSSRSQYPDSIEGTESREANISIEITQPITAPVEISREIPKPQHSDFDIHASEVKRPTITKVKLVTSPQQSAGQSDDFEQYVQTYVDFLKTKMYDEAKTTKQQLSTSFESQLAVTADDLKPKPQNDKITTNIWKLFCFPALPQISM